VEESRELKKIRRKLEVFSHRADIIPIAKENFCGPSSHNAEKQLSPDIPASESSQSSEPRTTRPWREISTHWIIGILAGVGVSYQGSYEVLVRCGVLAILFFWLVSDSWIILWKRPRHLLLSTILTIILFFIFAGSGYAIYFNDLQSKKDAVSVGLTITAPSSSDLASPFLADFTIRNNSLITVPRTAVSCVVNDAKYANGTADHDLISSSPTSYDSPLLPGGDGETYRCLGDAIPQTLRALGIEAGALTCVDITIQLEYAMPFEKKGTPEQKFIRMVARRGENGFHWYQQNLTLPKGSCTGA
jgi:hypothetical protein